MKTLQLVAQINDDSQTEALKAFLLALKIPFEIKENEYSKEFTAKLHKSLTQAQKGEVKKLDLDDIWSP